MKHTYILADRNDNGEYDATELLNGDPEEEFHRFEYGDVAEGIFQIWEYPSGKIFDVIPDRKVSEKEYYSLPNDGLWLPSLKEAGLDPSKVKNAFRLLTN